MKQSKGIIPLYNIMIVFVLITFGFIAATLSYMKAFKVNGRIAQAIEDNEGYNSLAIQEIDEQLGTIGYRVGGIDESACPIKKKDGREAQGQQIIAGDNYTYCLYEWPYYVNGDETSRYFTYGILTYIFIDIPVTGGTFKIPVYSETEKIFEFSLKGC